jgi:hypothetical protein
MADAVELSVLQMSDLPQRRLRESDPSGSPAPKSQESVVGSLQRHRDDGILACDNQAGRQPETNLRGAQPFHELVKSGHGCSLKPETARLDDDLVTDRKIAGRLTSPHAHFGRKHFNQNDLNVVWRDAERLQIFDYRSI